MQGDGRARATRAEWERIRVALAEWEREWEQARAALLHGEREALQRHVARMVLLTQEARSAHNQLCLWAGRAPS